MFAGAFALVDPTTRALVRNLTPRQREVLELITREMGTREIAQVSPKTIETHRAAIMTRTNTRVAWGSLCSLFVQEWWRCSWATEHCSSRHLPA
jgi:FixJ family two-component response regulator